MALQFHALHFYNRLYRELTGIQHPINMEQHFCQSCGMPLTDENRGTNADGSRSEDYCTYCYQSGKFTQDFTMNQMVEFCLQFLDQMNAHTGQKLTPLQAKEQMLQYFPHLKRWKEADNHSIL